MSQPEAHKFTGCTNPTKPSPTKSWENHTSPVLQSDRPVTPDGPSVLRIINDKNVDGCVCACVCECPVGGVWVHTDVLGMECGCTQMCSGWSVEVRGQLPVSFPRCHPPCFLLVGWLLCLFLRQGPLLTWKPSTGGLPNEFQRGTYFCLPDTGITIAQHHTQRFHMDSDN